MFAGPFDESMLWKAQNKNLVKIQIHDLRHWGEGERKSVDDRPYGGGVGMLLRVDILDKAITDLKSKTKKSKTKVVLLDAGGEKFNQKKAVQLSKLDNLILIAGHYEGFDFRVNKYLADEIISIGDYVLTGGELPAMVLVDSIVRLIPGVLEKEGVKEIESHTTPGYIEYPQYTRPDEYKGWRVPEILKTGNHPEIEKWRKQESDKRTKKVRPYLAQSSYQ